jgi:hypothetical protein
MAVRWYLQIIEQIRQKVAVGYFLCASEEERFPVNNGELGPIGKPTVAIKAIYSSTSEASQKPSSRTQHAMTDAFVRTAGKGQ